MSSILNCRYSTVEVFDSKIGNSRSSVQNHLRNAAINFDKNLFDPILETAPGSPSTTTHRRMSVRFDLNGEVLFAGRIASSNYESNPTFIESSRSSAGIHEPVRSGQINQFVYP